MANRLEQRLANNDPWCSEQLTDISEPRKSYIRLLKIFPAAYDAPVRCALFVTRLDSQDIAGIYDALSYCWGDLTQWRTIEVNATPDFKVTANLFNAIQRLRDRRIPRNVWIDAICIRQTDVWERNAQIQLMRMIFGQARRVYVWLGELEVFEHQNPNFRVATGTNSQTRLRFWPEPGAVQKAYEIKLKSGPAGSKEAWWDRTWVVQEIMSAREPPFVLLGHYELRWDVFVRQFTHPRLVEMTQLQKGLDNRTILTMSSLMLRTGRLQNTALVNSLIVQHKIAWDTDTSFLNDPALILPLQRLRQLCNDQEKPSLHRLLEHTRHTKVSDGRDKVFALLGLIKDRDRKAIVPDYRKSLRIVFTEVTLHFLNVYRNIDILLGPWQRCLQAHGQLPSWVPNFCQPASQWNWGTDKLSIQVQRLPALDGESLVFWGQSFDEVAYVWTDVSESKVPTIPFSSWTGLERLWKTHDCRFFISYQLLPKLNEAVKSIGKKPPTPFYNLSKEQTTVIRSVFVTAGHRVGISREYVEREDLLAFAHTAARPLLLRAATERSYTLVDAVVTSGPRWLPAAHEQNCCCKRIGIT